MESLEISELFLKIKHSWNMHIYRMRHLIRLVHPGEGETVKPPTSKESRQRGGSVEGAHVKVEGQIGCLTSRF